MKYTGITTGWLTYLRIRISKRARARGIVHRTRVAGLSSRSSVSKFQSRLESRPAETSMPVRNRNTPTPPMHPRSMLRGKKLTRPPSLKAPRRKKIMPVRTELRAYAVMTVAMTAAGLERPM